MESSALYAVALLQILCSHLCESLEFAPQQMRQDASSSALASPSNTNEHLPISKRAGKGMKAFPFPCNGYDNMPRCLHGGKGPRKTYTKSGRFCVCFCPPKWIGAQCAFAADSGMGKRASMDERDQDVLQAALGAAFSGQSPLGNDAALINAAAEDKRGYGPWQVMDDEEKRGYGPWSMMDSTAGKRQFPWQIVAEDKRSYPWVILDNEETNAVVPKAEEQQKRLYDWNPVLHRPDATSALWEQPRDAEMNKKSNPWHILAGGTDKRNVPWKILNFERRGLPWKIYAAGQKDKRVMFLDNELYDDAY